MAYLDGLAEGPGCRLLQFCDVGGRESEDPFLRPLHQFCYRPAPGYQVSLLRMPLCNENFRGSTHGGEVLVAGWVVQRSCKKSGTNCAMREIGQWARYLAAGWKLRTCQHAAARGKPG